METLHITKAELHTFIDTQIEKHKSKKGRAFFYKKPKKLEVIGEKRIMRFFCDDFKTVVSPLVKKEPKKCPDTKKHTHEKTKHTHKKQENTQTQNIE